MLTDNTFRVSDGVMTFPEIISRWPTLQALASDLGLPVKNVRRWRDLGSIPAEWFVAVVEAARARGFDDVDLVTVAAAAHGRRLSRATETAKAASPHLEGT